MTMLYGFLSNKARKYEFPLTKEEIKKEQEDLLKKKNDEKYSYRIINFKEPENLDYNPTVVSPGHVPMNRDW